MRNFNLKLTSLGLTGVLALSLALSGCGSTSGDNNSKQDSSATADGKQETAASCG